MMERMAWQMIDIKETDLNFSSLSERPYTDQIVIHHTGGNDIDASAEQIHGWHLKNGWAGIGYHYVIRKDGTIERGRPEWAIGSHAYGENSHTIGIHLSGEFDSAEPTAEQVEKCAMLIADIADRYSLPIDRDTIVGHGELMSTDCPGTNLQALLDDGTITGKAVWYYNQSHDVADDVSDMACCMEKQDGSRQAGRGMERYITVDSVPDWAKPTVQKMIDKGLLNGNGESLDLSLDMLRIFVVNDRAGMY
jgi:hypothetical protein